MARGDGAPREWLSAIAGRSANQLIALIRRATRSRNADPRRIAVICDSFIRYGTSQAIGLKSAGADVVFYYIDRLGEFDGNAEDRAVYLDRVAEAGIPVVALPQRNLRRMLQHIWALHRDLAQRRVGTLIVQAHIDPRYATLPFRFPVAMVIHDPRPHSGDFESSYPLPVRALARFAEMSSSAVFMHSPLLVPQLFPMLRRIPIGFFPHGTDMAEGPADIVSPPTLVLVGRLMEYKGIDTALRAFGQVRKARPDCTMVLAGRGNMGDEIRATSPDGVELRDGYIPDAELDALIQGARLILLPYKDATQSGVGLVSVAQGIPCIVSRAGALPDLVPPTRPDWIVPVDDAERLAEVVLRQLDHAEAAREEVFEYARENFAWPVVGRQMLEELDRLTLRALS